MLFSAAKISPNNTFSDWRKSFNQLVTLVNLQSDSIVSISNAISSLPISNTTSNAITSIDANNVAFIPFGNITASNVQDAIEQVVANTSNNISPSSANVVSFVPFGNITASNVQDAIEQLDSVFAIEFFMDTPEDVNVISYAHINGTLAKILGSVDTPPQGTLTVTISASGNIMSANIASGANTFGSTVGTVNVAQDDKIFIDINGTLGASKLSILARNS